MKIKVKFIVVKSNGRNCSFIETIDIPDVLTTIDEQDGYISELDKSDIMVKHDVYVIIDFFRYVSKPRGEKKPTWKQLAKQSLDKTNEVIKIVDDYKELYEITKSNCDTAITLAENWKKLYYDLLSTIDKSPEPDVQKPKGSIDTGLPVDITKNYSGGWLAPNGDFYGMDGDYADMIHAKLGDKLLELGIVPEEKDGFHNPDSWLCQNGWVKIHYDSVLYDGYLIAKRSKFQDDLNMPIVKAIPLTDKQREQIYVYGSLCWKSVLRFGLPKNELTMPKFKMMDKAMIWKLFDF